jgi:hypothetical protein
MNNNLEDHPNTQKPPIKQPQMPSDSNFFSDWYYSGIKHGWTIYFNQVASEALQPLQIGSNEPEGIHEKWK